MRKSLKELWDEVLFDFFKTEIAQLHALAQEEEALEVWFSDESSFHLNPNGVYAWQPPKGQEPMVLPTDPQKVLNVLGFITQKKQEGVFYEFEGSMTAELFIALTEDFIRKQVQQKTVLLLDKSSAHYAKEVQDKIPEWKAKNLFLQYLPSYSPELNAIEVLCLKQQWINISDWLSADTLKERIRCILKNYGTEFQIVFQT